MASNIDITKPVTGNATTQSVRDNFAAAKTEIEALQAGKVAGSLDSNNKISALLNPDNSVAFTIYNKREYPIVNYGPTHQAKRYDTASMTAGSSVISVAGYTFTSDDVGKTLGVAGAGTISSDLSALANDGVLVGTILSVSGGNATLSVNAVTTVANAPCVFGFPNDTSISAAIAACQADYAIDGIPGVVIFPAGRYLVINSQPITSGVSFKGVGRGFTKIYVTKVVADANDSLSASWIRKATGQGQVVFDQVNLSDFTLIGTFFATSGGYGPDMKMINMSLTSNSTVQRMEIIDNPSTALGYDESVNCLLADNIIINPGRVAQITSVTGTAGGSGIGIAVSGQNKDLSMIVRNNFIKGKWTSAGGTGRSGINIEASSSTSIPTTYYGGIILEGNVIEGMYNGIIDSGGVGTIAKANQVRKCTRGIVSGTNGVGTGAMGRDMIIVGNVVRDCFTQGSFTGVGIQVTASNVTKDTESESLISDNVVTGTVGGYGIQINGTASFPVRNVAVRGNIVARNGLSGIRVAGTIFGLDVANNKCIANGQSGTTGNKAPISVAASCAWTDGRLQNNTYTDYQTVVTQDAVHSISGTAVLTNVRLNGNTGDAS